MMFDPTKTGDIFQDPWILKESDNSRWKEERSWGCEVIFNLDYKRTFAQLNPNRELFFLSRVTIHFFLFHEFCDMLEPPTSELLNRQLHTMWGPQDSVQLVYNSNFTMVYGTYNELVTGTNLNQLTSLGGLTLYVLCGGSKSYVDPDVYFVRTPFPNTLFHE